MIGVSLVTPPMMILGTFIFSLNTAAYQTLRRRVEHRWPAQERFGQREALQYTGPGSDTITLEGVVYPAFRGGNGQLSNLRELAAKGQPQIMVDGLGNMMGRWVIESVEERQDNFVAFGLPRKQEFSMTLRRFDDITQDNPVTGAVRGFINGL